MALTPAARHLGLQVSPLISPHLPNIPPPATLCAPVSLCTPQPAYRTCFGLRLERAGSSPHTAESSSSSCGLPVRLQLLPTPPRGDAVTFSYRVLAYPGTDFHRAGVAPSRAHSLRPAGSFLDLAATRHRPLQQQWWLARSEPGTPQDQAGGAFGAAASRGSPQGGGQPRSRMPRRPDPAGTLPFDVCLMLKTSNRLKPPNPPPSENGKEPS